VGGNAAPGADGCCFYGLRKVTMAGPKVKVATGHGRSAGWTGTCFV
jgi:hypothetical protein